MTFFIKIQAEEKDKYLSLPNEYQPINRRLYRTGPRYHFCGHRQCIPNPLQRKEEEEKHRMKNDNKSFWAQPLKPWGACLTD
jgi:hypothetical protein